MSTQQGNRFFFNVDWITILIFVALCTIGFVNIYASVYNPETADVFDFSSNYGKQLIFILTAIILGFSILLVDAKFFSVFSPIIYGMTILLLLVVLVVGRNELCREPGLYSHRECQAPALRIREIRYGFTHGALHQHF